MRTRRGLALLTIAVLPLAASANVWVITHRTNIHAGAEVDTMGSISIGNAPMGTLLTEYTSGPAPKKLRELYMGGKHYHSVSVKPDGSEVIASFSAEGGGLQWCVFNFARMQKEQKLTLLNPGPGYEAVDARYVDGMPALLTRKGSEVRCDGITADGGWRKLYSSAVGDLSGLSAFPHLADGAYATELAAKAAFGDYPRLSVRSDGTPWALFGPRGASAFGGFDPKAGIVAVRSAQKGEDLTIARVTPQGPLPPIVLTKPIAVNQIAIVDGITYVALPSDKILVYDRAGKLTATLYGTALAAD